MCFNFPNYHALKISQLKFHNLLTQPYTQKSTKICLTPEFFAKVNKYRMKSSSDLLKIKLIFTIINNQLKIILEP